MNLASFTALVLAKWGDITSPKRTPDKDRDVADAIKGELWSLPSHEISVSTHTNTTSPISGVSYDFWIRKSGNQTVLTGFIMNSNTYAITVGTVLFSLIPSELSTISGGKSFYWRGDNITLEILDLDVKARTPFFPNTSVRFTLTYLNNQ